jgi:cysteine desulfurase / selenocysteine lyase
MDVTSARAQFPGLADKVFLDAACVSLASRASVEAIRTFMDHAMLCPLESSTHHHIFMDAMRSAARPAVARLINAQEDEIALVESTSQGLSVIANSIPLKSGDRILLSDIEFFEVAIPWLQRQSEGIEIDVVPNYKGEVRVENFAERITERTRVIAISTVQWTNGYRVDLKGFGALCRKHNIWLVVDAIQQLGAVPLDLRETPVDFLACGGHKWLNAPYGCGFLYINGEALARLKLPITGYLSVQDPPGGWGAYFQDPDMKPVKNYEFVASARRLEGGGTANYPGAIGLAASLKMIHDVGPDHIYRHIFALTQRLIEGVDQLGLTLVTPRSEQHRSGIVTFSTGSAQEDVRVMNELLAKRILVSVRYTSRVGGIRVSCHFYNSATDIDALLRELQRVLNRAIGAP